MRLLLIHLLTLCILFFAWGVVCAQAYPSPTLQTLTLQTPLSIANGGTGTSSAMGTGAVLLANAPTITTPTLIGVSNGSNAIAGAVGEYLSASASSVSLTTNTFTNLASLTLSAGDWNVSGGFYISDSGGTLNNIAAGIRVHEH